MKSIVSFKSSEKSETGQIGGKALNLMAMYREGFEVPPAIVLSVDFFLPWMVKVLATGLWSAWRNAGMGESGSIAKELQLFCGTLTFDTMQKNEFDMALIDFQDEFPGSLYAVRSSSPEEDLVGSSFAGVYETTLGVKTEGLEDAVRSSFASCFDERVFLYMKEQGIAMDMPRMAVMIQRQIDAETAGVGFSLNPVNNSRDEAVINANGGLGESVVSGETEPDLFVVDKVKKQVTHTQIGGKQVSVTLGNDGGTLVNVRPAQKEACISSSQVLEIASLICRIEEYHQFPVDIEWAIVDARLYLLQVRPITTYHPLPDEMMTGPGEPKRLYANSTLIEQGLHGPMSVLGTDFLSFVLKQMSSTIGGDLMGVDGMTFTAGGQYYMNLSNSLKIGGMKLALAPGSSDDATVLDMLKRIELSEYIPVKMPEKLRSVKRNMLFRMLPTMGNIMKAVRHPAGFMGKYEAELPAAIERFTARGEAGETLRQYAERMTGGLDFFLSKYGIPAWFAGKIAKERLKKLFQDEMEEARDCLVSIGMALPGNKTTEMGAVLYRIASSDDIRRFDDAGGFLEALRGNRLNPEFIELWNEFLAEFGARCPREIDAATSRPKENPALLFEQAKMMSLSIMASGSGASFFEQAVRKREAAYDVLLAMATKKGKKACAILKKNYITAFTFGGFRETGKHYVIMAVDLFRQKVLDIGAAFVTQGRLDFQEQIFDLSIADIDRAETNLFLDLRSLGVQRTAFSDRLRKSHHVVRIIDSRGKIFFPPAREAGEGGLAGSPISPGTVRGRAKVFHHATEKQLLPGEILVARATDPGWTPLFINARGIVLEIGGALQHGATVAREYGIPCVSGITGAIDMIKDGQLLEVDGSNGIVRLLDERDEESPD